MCNRYRMTASRAEVAARYGYPVVIEPERVPPPELFPEKPAWIVREEDGRRLLDVATWGFPHTVKGAKGQPLKKLVTNVRNYTSPFWRTAMASPERRCLVPFTAFSEYGQVRGGDGKLPLHWFDVPSRPIVSFAGVWRHLEGGRRAYAFLTCEPNPIVAPIHPKAMPVLLDEADEEKWLACSFEDAIGLAQPYPSQLMTVS